MTECKNDNTNCTNLRLRTARKGEFTGKRFFGCYLYPDCLHLIPLHFDGTNMTEEQKELYRVFYLFVRSNMFIDATFGVVYFNLKHAAFLDYLLKTDVVYFADNVEIGFTGAKIYHELFCHLFLIPSLEIKHYLINRPINNTQRVTENGDGSITLHLTITNNMEIIPLIGYWTPHIKVITPEHLYQAVVQRISPLIRDYEII